MRRLFAMLIALAWLAGGAGAAELTKPVPKPVAKPGMAPRSDPAGDTDILRAQVLLDRAHFSSGEIDGTVGSNLRRAVTGFQKLRQLPVTGKLDDATWAALKADPAPTLDVYTLTAEDIAGPYAPVPQQPGAAAQAQSGQDVQARG